MILLQDFPPHVVAKIEKITGSDDDVSRLASLGVITGTVIIITKEGSPCIFNVRGSQLCVRASHDLEIHVSRVDE